MTLIIVFLLVMGYLTIATGHLTNVNKAAIAIFIATAGWVVYICYGTDFVMSEHPDEYARFLGGTEPSSDAVKYFIYNNVFLKYVGEAASIILFLLSTMTIVEILNNNGCFDFISEWIRTRNSKRLLWTITIATFIISANLDNLTTTTMMLVIMHKIVQSRRQRMLIGCAIVLAANCGGCFTPTMLINRSLPSRLDTEWAMAPYRGDDTNLNRWQRLVMLFLGIGGLWFIPTFHSITKLSPFLGALCVLAVLWVVNELFNRKLMNADQMIHRQIPRVLQYGSLQQILFVLGIMLGMGVVIETGVFNDVAGWFGYQYSDIWLVAVVSGLLSSAVDTFTIAMTDISLYPIGADHFATNGAYWKLIPYCTAVGGCLTTVGSISGIAMMKMEHMHLGWYLRNMSWKVLIGALVGLGVLYLELTYMG